MSTNARFAEVAALAGDPARAAILHALMDGRALTATELADAAGVARQTASGHLGQLTVGGLLAVQQQGRHRYYRLASPAVAHMLESIMLIASGADAPARKVVTGPKDQALRFARTCYDHFAGRLGVALADALAERGHVELDIDGGEVTEGGLVFLAEVGVATDALRARRMKRSGRVLCRPCLDWSERRPHLAGMVGAAICAHSMDAEWTRRTSGGRAVTITPKGRQVFQSAFGARL